MQCDVLIIGGGSAGLAAGVSAARAGARVVIVERHGALGGMATASLVHSICGLYLLNEQPGNPGNPVATPANPGVATELAGRLIATGGAAGPVRMGRVDVLLQHPTAMARVADVMVGELPNLTVCFHTELIAVDADADGVRSIEVVCRGARWTIEAKAVVDASGDGVAAALSGAGFEQTDSGHLQRSAFVFAMQGVDEAAAGDDARLRIAAMLAQAVREGRLPDGVLGAAMRATGRGGEVFITIDLPGPDGMAYDPTDPRCLAALEVLGRGLAHEVAGFLHDHVQGFERSTISALPTRVGVRESRRVLGRYRIEAGDLQRGASFDDAIGLATWPQELRETARGPRWRFPEDVGACGGGCEIPLRALRSAKFDNLFVAGRCLSCSHEAQAALRVIGTCLVTGEAAGLAAALVAAGGEAEAQAVKAAREEWVMPVARPWHEVCCGATLEEPASWGCA